MPRFTERLLGRVIGAQWADIRGNYDHCRFGPAPESGAWDWLRWQGRRVARRAGVVWRKALVRPKIGPFATWMQMAPELEWLYERLQDDQSRDLLVELIAYRIMGPRGIRLSTHTPDYWSRVEQLAKLADPADAIPIAFHDWQLLRHDLTPIDYPIEVYCRSVLTQYVLEQYACPRLSVSVAPGDVVLDGGGCWGDTALYFAHKAGAAGKVYSFEFIESNVAILQRNLAINPELAPRVDIVRHPMWSRSGVPMLVEDRGPASSIRLLDDEPAQPGTIETVSIDDFVRTAQLDRVDFIKMDIEGAELEALHGAEDTIRRFRPQLAISVYHQPDHFVHIPRFLDRIHPEYRFALGHFTIHAEETVLFAADKR